MATHLIWPAGPASPWTGTAPWTSDCPAGSTPSRRRRSLRGLSSAAPGRTCGRCCAGRAGSGGGWRAPCSWGKSAPSQCSWWEPADGGTGYSNLPGCFALYLQDAAQRWSREDLKLTNSRMVVLLLRQWPIIRTFLRLQLTHSHCPGNNLLSQSAGNTALRIQYTSGSWLLPAVTSRDGISIRARFPHVRHTLHKTGLSSTKYRQTVKDTRPAAHVQHFHSRQDISAQCTAKAYPRTFRSLIGLFSRLSGGVVSKFGSLPAPANASMCFKTILGGR